MVHDFTAEVRAVIGMHPFPVRLPEAAVLIFHDIARDITPPGVYLDVRVVTVYLPNSSVLVRYKVGIIIPLCPAGTAGVPTPLWFHQPCVTPPWPWCISCVGPLSPPLMQVPFVLGCRKLLNQPNQKESMYCHLAFWHRQCHVLQVEFDPHFQQL